TSLECVVREIHEEIGFLPERIEYLASHDGVDIDVDGGTIHADFFIIREVPVDALVITEGSLLIVKPEDIRTIETKLTPSARLGLTAFFDKHAVAPVR